VETDADGKFTGMIDALGSGLYRVNILVNGGMGSANPYPEPIRLQIDDEAPMIVGHEPSIVSTNSTEFQLQFDIQEVDSGLLDGGVQVSCIQIDGLQSFGDVIEGLAVKIISGDVSRYLVNLSSQPVQSENLDCWFDVADLAGNNLTGEGSAKTWPLRLEVIETRPDLSAEKITILESPVIGQLTTVSIVIYNTGTDDTTPFNITLQTHLSRDDRIVIEEVETVQTSILNGGMITVSFEWMPDWEGELDLVVLIDSSQDIDEFNEDNAVLQKVKIEPVPEPDGFFASQSMMALFGMGIIGVACVGLLFIASRRIGESDDSEWLEDEEDAEGDEEYDEP
jgi:hypothetical protein